MQSDDTGRLARRSRLNAKCQILTASVRRQPSSDPLILTGHGVSLKIEAGTLLIRNGFTHYPQKQETYRYFKGDADLPPRIIMLDGSGSLTFDVLTWLNEQKCSRLIGPATL